MIGGERYRLHQTFRGRMDGWYEGISALWMAWQRWRHMAARVSLSIEQAWKRVSTFRNQNEFVLVYVRKAGAL